MKDLAGKRVLVTGAADGIGRGAALAFAREGSKLILVDVDRKKVEEVAEEVRLLGAECSSYMVDVSDPRRVEHLTARIDDEFGGVDVLVNVAGVCVVADIIDTSLDDWDWILGVNLYGPINMIGRFLPGMMERRSGHIVNVASAGGLVHLGVIGAYCTTKAGLVALSEALAQEVRADGVRVTAFCPGLTDTPMIERMRFCGYSREKLLRIADAVRARLMMSTERSGELIVEAVKRERALVVTTRSARAVVMINRLFPGFVRFVLRRGKRLNDRFYGKSA